MKISKSDTLASKPTSSEPILPLCEAEFRHNPYPCHSFSQAPSHQIRCSFKVAVPRATTWHGTKYLRVAGTYKRLLTSQALGKHGMDSLFWASGLNKVKPRTPEEQECEGNRRLPPSRSPHFPISPRLSQSLRPTVRMPLSARVRFPCRLSISRHDVDFAICNEISSF